MARPAIEGVVRYHSGRINQAETAKLIAQVGKREPDTAPPSPKILHERQLFNAKCFKGGNQAQHAGDAIGQLWLCGKLDVKGYDETRLLEAVRTWWRGREEALKEVGFKTASYERASRTTSGSTKASKLERAYHRYESFLRDASISDQALLRDLMETDLDGGKCQWAMRIVQTSILAKHIMPEILLLSGARDDDNMAGAMRAILAMAGAEALVGNEERVA